MRRNNGWLAILAISMVLPILRHGSAGEQLPLDYGNTNRSKSAYESRASNRATGNPRNHDNYQESFPLTNTDERLKSISQPVSFVERASSKGLEHREEDSRGRTAKSFDERITGTEILDAIRNSSSTRIHSAATKNRSRTNEPRRREKQTLTSETPSGNQLAEPGHPYYGHVPGNLKNDKFLKNSGKGGREEDDAKGFLAKKVDVKRVGDGSSLGTVKNDTLEEHQDIYTNNANSVLFINNESTNKSTVINGKLGNNDTDDSDLKLDNTSVYSLINNENSVNKSIGVLKQKGNEKLEENLHGSNAETPYLSFYLRSLNRIREEHSSNSEDELTFNKSVTEDPMGNETLLKQGSPTDKNARGDNGSIFSMDPDFRIAFTESNTGEYPSVAKDSRESNRNQEKTIPREIMDFDNETNGYEKSSLELNFIPSMENESLISSIDLLYLNSSNQNQEIRENFNNETGEENEIQEVDFIFDENNTTDYSLNEEDSMLKALDLNVTGPENKFLTLDNEHESQRQNSKETDAIELNATWIQLNEHEADEFVGAQEQESLFEGVTKDAEVSAVESFTESSVHSIIKVKEHLNKETNLSKTIERQIKGRSEESAIKTVKIKSKTSMSSEKEKNIIFFKIPLESSKLNPENRFLDQSKLSTRRKVQFKERFNESIMISNDERLVLRKAVDEIKYNEPVAGFRWKNAGNKGVGDRSGDNGTLNQVNPTRNEGKDIEHPTDERSMDRRLSDGIMASWINERFPKGRKSRSSKVASTTSTSLEFGSSNLNQLHEETSSASSDEDARWNSNVSDDPTVSLAHPSELVLRNQSKNLTRIIQLAGESLGGENDTFSTTEFGSPSIGDEGASFGFDVNPLDANGEGRASAEDGSYKVNNSSVEMEPLNQWPVKHSAVVEGDLVLGGLMMVHEREDTITCGPVMPQGGVQALEAMLYTLDRLNERGIVPGVKIGAHILDDCDKDTYGLEMAVDFIKGSISNIDGAEYHCNKTAVRKVISGVVGAASSVTSIQVANLLRLFRIPQVSFFSTSPELSNKQRFEYFTRTIPSDHYQVKAMVDIVLRMGWSYVSIIYEESNYGIKAFEELEELLGKHDICIAIKEKLVKDSGVAEETAYDNIVLKLLTKPRARGCIIFGSDQEVAGVMRAVRRCNATGAFSWIGSDGWSARGLVSNGNEAEVEGTLSVQPQANPVKGFEEYFLNLTVENNRRNPWFVEFWEDHFQCRYPNASRTPYNQKYTKPCTTKERLTKQNTAFEDQLQFVSDAVMAFAYAFRDMHRDLCHGKPGLCDAMKPTKGTELLKYLRKVDFEGLSGDKFKFDKNGDGPARYNIIHFKQVQPGKYKWIRVGKYLEGELRLNMSEIQFKLGHPQPPESVCSLPCEVGQAKKYVEGERCCWHCFNCTQYQIRHPKDETQCIPCRQGTVPDETHSTCRDIPEEFLRPESGWAIGAMSFSAVGIMITLFVGGVFLKHNDTPVVRASGRELSYVLLSGILFCYLVTFALVLRPTDIVCCIQRFAAGFCFTVVYAALLTKTNRISRIFNASKHSAKRPSFISPRSQLIICSGLVFVQILINGVWMIIDPARAMHHYPTREDNLLVCNSYVDASYMIAFAYPIMLIVVCTVYAVLTRKIPEAFNESKHIGFTMYTTCVIWLAFVPLYFGTGNNVALRITSMSVTISLSASVTIACLFSPKLYIILIRPERNVRQSMMPARYSTTKSSAVTATNASSMIAPITLTAATCDQNKAVKKHIITTIDCSTQSEYYELEVKDRKNGKPPPTVVSRSTQTSGTNEKDTNAIVSSKDSNENTATTKQLNNNARIGNGPVNQSDVPL